MQANGSLVAAFDGGDHHVFAALRAFDQGVINCGPRPLPRWSLRT
jgi:hypothetical protein